jgi:hypothetical protein
MTLLLLLLLLLTTFAVGALKKVTLKKHNPERERVVVHVTQDEAKRNVDALAEEHGYENLGEMSTLPGHYVFERDINERKRDEMESANERLRARVEWLGVQTKRRLAKRAEPVKEFTEPSDPEYRNQWHLFGTGNNPYPHLNVPAAWRQGVFGRGVHVSVVDDGLQFLHPDLMENYDQRGSYDWNDQDDDVTPHPRFDDHGTPAAGLCCGARNGEAFTSYEEAFCGVGVAYMSYVSGLRLIATDTEDWQEAHINWAQDVVDVYSNSWGPTDDGNRLEGPGPLAAAAVENAIRNGRGGRGSIYVFAGGNGRSHGDNCNYDGWANWRYTITIAAVTFAGKQPWYSEDCSALVASVPSSGDGHSITTTDLLGQVGTSGRDCTSSFSGTSAAAPMAAGVVALLLDANPKLGWRDVQAVIIDSVSPVDATDSDWQTNGDGRNVSHRYGFGMMNAGRAVQLAKAWRPWPRESLPLRSGWRQPNVMVNLGQNASHSFSFDDSHLPDGVGSLDDLVVEHVEVNVTLESTFRGTLAIQLRAPSGVVSRLQEFHHDNHKDITNWRYQSIFSWGESPKGEWTMTMISEHNSDATSRWAGYFLQVHTHKRDPLVGKPSDFEFREF